jgi:predicted dehydrogenase
MIKPVSFGLIGAGGIGAYHRVAIESNETADRAVLAAVADPWADRLADQKARLEGRGVRWYMDYRELLRREEDLDAVVIATPIPFHFDMTMACIERGIFIHLEKPPVPLMKQFDELIAADQRQTISVGFQMIGSCCTQLLKNLIVEGKLGEVQEIRAAGCWPRMDNYYSRASWAGRMDLEGSPVFDGPTTNAFAHLVHNIMYFAGEGQDRFAVPTEVEGELYRARPIESYDTACMRGKFASGAEFSLAVTHATEEALPFKMEVRGTAGWARLTEDGAKLESSVGAPCQCPQDTQELLDVNYTNFIDVLQGKGTRYLTRLADARGYMAATNAMLTSSGGIHTIPSTSFRQYMSDGSGGYDVQNLRAAVEETFVSGRMFHEQDLPWAKAEPVVVSIASPALA